MGTAKCPNCGHIHSTSMEVEKTKEHLSGTSRPVETCDNCEKKFVLVF